MRAMLHENCILKQCVQYSIDRQDILSKEHWDRGGGGVTELSFARERSLSSLVLYGNTTKVYIPKISVGDI